MGNKKKPFANESFFLELSFFWLGAVVGEKGRGGKLMNLKTNNVDSLIFMIIFPNINSVCLVGRWEE